MLTNFFAIFINLSQITKVTFSLWSLSMLLSTQIASEGISDIEPVEYLALDIISYNDFISDDLQALQTLGKALHEKGIVGIKGVPGYQEKLFKYIESARLFSALPEDIKDRYAPNYDLGDTFLGYEKGKEKFMRPDGTWVVDDLKVSFYGFVPEIPQNKWPREIDLKTPFQDIATMLSDMGQTVMQKIGLIGSNTGIYLDQTAHLGRLLYYRKSVETSFDNPFWCGAHFDHGMFTSLLPAFYFSDGEAIPEPLEAGLFVKTASEGVFKKVVADDTDVMLFQVGEFGQLVTDDGIKATEHRVHKALGAVERYTMALFFLAPPDTTIYSHSELTYDSRYPGGPDAPCTYQTWADNSFNRYIVK